MSASDRRGVDRRAFAELAWPFAGVSAAAAVVPLAEMSGVVGASDLVYVAFVFGLLLAVELVALRIVLAYALPPRAHRWFSRAWLAAALAANVAGFFSPLINATIPVLVAIPLAAGALFWALAPHERLRRGMLAFACLFMAISIGKAVVHAATVTPPPKPLPREERSAARAQRNVYVLSFDALVSSRALSELFGVHADGTRDALERLGFRVGDTLSAGENTLSTFGRMLSMGEPFNHTIARTFFNGLRPVPLYQRLRREGYRIQFIYATEYFGVDAQQIDYFYPQRATPIICEFVDSRYSLFGCRPWFRSAMERWFGVRLMARSGHDLQDEVEFERILERFKAAARDSGRWFSIAYLWYPGHSPLNHRYSDTAAVDDYRSQYLARVPKVAAYVERLVSEIRREDPDALIVIFGDHGALVARGAEVGDTFDGRGVTASTIELDRRGVLLGIHPGSVCPELVAMRDIGPLFGALLDCLATGERPAAR